MQEGHDMNLESDCLPYLPLVSSVLAHLLLLSLPQR